MDFFEALVVLVPVCLIYKLLSELIAARKEVRTAKFRNLSSQTTCPPHAQEDPADLSLRASELQRRLATLEEIITSERRAS